MLYIPTTAHTGAAHKVEFDILFTFVDRFQNIGTAAILYHWVPAIASGTVRPSRLVHSVRMSVFISLVANPRSELLLMIIVGVREPEFHRYDNKEPTLRIQDNPRKDTQSLGEGIE